ncbi:mCG142540, isoform CRA_b, partial [Mus musculus]
AEPCLPASAPPHTAKAPNWRCGHGQGRRHNAGKGKKGKGRPKTSGKKQKLKKQEVDIMSPAAMLNLYYIAHNVADCLYLRGFPWPGAPKGKRGKK